MTDFDIDRAMPQIGNTLYGRLRADTGDAWDAYIHHRFVAELANGTLPREEFLNWMVQDYLYLVSYARAYAILVYKSETVARMRRAGAILSGLLDTEMSLHRQQLAAAGITQADLDSADETLETLAYGRYVLDRAQAGDALDLTVTLSACLLGYAEVGLRLCADPATKIDGNPYRAWIETYGGPAYLGLAREGLASLEELSRTCGGDARYPSLLKQFGQTVYLEAAFWNAGRSTQRAA